MTKRRWKAIFELLNPRIRPDYASNLSRAVAVCAIPFNSYLDDCVPDGSNTGIAFVAKDCLEQYPDLPFLGQREETNLIRLVRSENVIQYPSYDGEWVQTHKLAKFMAETVLSWGRGNKVILVGHPHHVRRCTILLRYYGLDPLIAPECANIPYDSRYERGRQIWCLSPFLYIPWEYFPSRAGLIVSLALGKI